MKSFIAAIVILCILVVGMFFYTTALANAKDSLKQITTEIREDIKNEEWEEMDKRVDKLSEEWEELVIWLPCLVEHDEIDNVMISVASIREYSAYRELPELMAEISVLEELIDHIPFKEQPIPQNIL